MPVIKNAYLFLVRTPVKTFLITVFLSGVVCLSLIGVGMYINSTYAIADIHSSFVTTGRLTLKRGLSIHRVKEIYGDETYDGSFDVISFTGYFGGGGGNSNMAVFKHELNPLFNSEYVGEVSANYTTYALMSGAKRVLMSSVDGLTEESQLFGYDNIFVGKVLSKNIVSQREEGAHTIYGIEVLKPLRGEFKGGEVITLVMFESVGMMIEGSSYMLGADKSDDGSYTSALLSVGLANYYLASDDAAMQYVMYNAKNYLLYPNTGFDKHYAFVNGYPFGVSAVTAQFTSNFNYTYAYRNGFIGMLSGEMFTEEDYENGSRVAIISEYLAGANNLEIGDTIRIALTPYSSVMMSDRLTVSNLSGNHADLLEGSVFAEPGEDEYTEYIIKGIYFVRENTRDVVDALTRYNSIYVPLNSYKTFDPFIDFFVRTMRAYDENISYDYRFAENTDDGWIYDYDQTIYYLNQTSFTLNRNDVQEEFLADAVQNGLDLGVFSVSFDDQGYNVVGPALDELKKTSVNWIIGCSLAAIAALSFIVYLFVVKSRKDTAIMMCLGQKRRDIIKFMYVKVSMIAAVALVLGSFAGSMIAGHILSFTYNAYYSSRYDSLSLYQPAPGGFTFDSRLPLSAYVITAVCVLIMTLGISGFIVMQTLRTEPVEALSAAGRQG